MKLLNESRLERKIDSYKMNLKDLLQLNNECFYGVCKSLNGVNLCYIEEIPYFTTNRAYEQYLIKYQFDYLVRQSEIDPNLEI